MKKIIIFFMGTFVATHIFAQQIPEKFARDLDQVSTQYSVDMRKFLKSLPVSTFEFNPAQQKEYCGIVGAYVNDFYQLIQKNRDSLPFSYTNMTKHDVVIKVEQSKEMQILKKYNIKCNLDEI